MEANIKILPDNSSFPTTLITFSDNKTETGI